MENEKDTQTILEQEVAPEDITIKPEEAARLGGKVPAVFCAFSASIGRHCVSLQGGRASLTRCKKRAAGGAPCAGALCRLVDYYCQQGPWLVLASFLC